MNDGFSVGPRLGAFVGRLKLGAIVTGLTVGLKEGATGPRVGRFFDGPWLGNRLGIYDGTPEGLLVGVNVVGRMDGNAVGNFVGVGVEGSVVGRLEGSAVGAELHTGSDVSNVQWERNDRHAA